MAAEERGAAADCAAQSDCHSVRHKLQGHGEWQTLCFPCLGGDCCLLSLWKVQTYVHACLPMDHHRSVTEEPLNRKLSSIC